MNSISVIIPTYQHSTSISACIRSLLSQTLSPYEIIVVDDGSTDGTKEIVQMFLPQVSYHYQNNQGAPSARNAGADFATGDFLLFCDADVEAFPQMLDRLHRALREQEGASYAYSAFYWNHRLFHALPFDPDHLRNQNYIHTGALIRRNDFLGFDPTLKRFQDWDLWLSMLEKGKIGVAVDEPLFRVHNVKGRKGISNWLPSVVYRLPWQMIGWKPSALKAYDDAREIIVKKHALNHYR